MEGTLGKMNTQDLEGRSTVFLPVLHWYCSTATPPLVRMPLDGQCPPALDYVFVGAFSRF